MQLVAKWPDVISDTCTDAARRLNVNMCEFFQKAAENCRNGNGFSNSTEVGTKWFNTWKRSGYDSLPPVVREFILAVNNGEFVS